MEEMDPGATDRVLTREGHGMLGMSVDDVPYVVPMSFGYDGDYCYVQMSRSGRKNDAIASNSRVTLVVQSVDPDEEATLSVVVDGHIEEVPADEEATAMAALAENAEFGTDLEVWGVPVQDVELGLYRIVPASITGRRFGETFQTA